MSNNNEIMERRCTNLCSKVDPSNKHKHKNSIGVIISKPLSFNEAQLSGEKFFKIYKP